MKKILLILFSQLLFTNTWGQEYFQQIYNQSGTGECLFFQFDSNYLLLGMTDESGDNDITVTLLTTNFEVQWSNKIGSTQDDKPFDAILTSKGTFLITGYSGNGSKTLIVELDVNGNILNQFTLGSFHDRLKLVHETTEGDYLFYGELEGLVPGHNKVSVLKTDSNFNIIWKYYYDYESSTDIIGGEMYARRLVELSDGSYLILGNYTELNNASNNRRTRLLKINKEGDLQWVKGFHGGRMDNVMDVVLSQDENLIIVAQSNSFNSDGRSDILIMKSTLEGELMWSKAYSSGISMEVAQLLEDDDENILVAGTISNSIHGGDDILLFMTDEAGNHKKAVAMGGAYSDKGLSISKIDNGFILSGKSKSFDDFGEYKPYLSFINIEALSACLIDISDQITQTDVTMSIYEGIYSQSIFPNLEIGNFNSITHDMPATTVCWECPTGSLDTINICYNEPYTINYENSNATSFFWNNNSTESSLTVAQPGHYWVDLLVGACTVRDSIVIRVTPEIPDIEIEEEIVLCNGDSTLIELPYDNTFQYEWNDGSYQHRRFIQGAGTYSGKIESVCETKTFEVSVKIYDPISFIPNAFSPNNDPYNQYFVIDGIVDKVSLHILDRNGRTVFESTDYRNNWDAEGVESGTYFYIVQDQCRNESIKGWLQIIK